MRPLERRFREFFPRRRFPIEPMIDHERIKRAWNTARTDLLAERSAAGPWVGELASSALSTATAVSALALLLRHGNVETEQRERIEELIAGGLNWLIPRQNADGGWGDTDLSFSNIATTMLAQAAIRLTAFPLEDSCTQRAAAYVEAQGGVKGLHRRYGRDKTFAAPILANCALAGMVPWSEVAALPFEMACMPQRFYRMARLPVVSYAIPALVAIGQAKFLNDPPRGPLRWVRNRAVGPSVKVLERMQPASGGYLEAIPLTSFVMMSLAATGRADHAVTRSGLRFLLGTVREDGSWPIDSDLSTWNTTLAISALAAGGQEELEPLAPLLEWLLAGQYKEIHPFTGAAPGGWGWTNLSGAVPDSDDTPAALLALSRFQETLELDAVTRKRIGAAVTAGLGWLLDLQNRDGGWPTFCRGWGKLPFDRSGSDLTAHAIRALRAWKYGDTEGRLSELGKRGRTAELRGFHFLRRRQRRDGSWIPLWFGNQHHPAEENPVYGTAKVLLAYRDAGQLSAPPARAGLRWLVEHQNRDGSWGGGADSAGQVRGGVEETALALESLAAAETPAETDAWARGIAWLAACVEDGGHHRASPIGFYFAKLWYYERLYPLTFTVAALGQAIRRSARLPQTPSPAERLTNA